MAELRLADLLAALNAECSGQQALAYVRMLWETDRWSNFSGYAQTARNVEQTFKQIGLQDVQRVETPADGRYRVGDWTMPLAWDCADGNLRITSPKVSDPVLVRRFDQPNCVGMWSGPTGKDGLEAEVVFLDSGTEAEVRAKAGQVQGRWVLTPNRARDIKKAVADARGAGIITSWTRNKTVTDVVEWVNGWSDKPGGWMFTADDTPLPCMAISRTQHARLRRLKDEHGIVRVCATIDSIYFPGHLDYITARIVGRQQPEKEVLILGHLYEQGANDNASGCATILELARTLQALIDSGRIPRPRRSIRFLLMAECYGSLAYAQDNRSRLADTLVCACIDTGAGPVENARCFYQINLAPLCSWSFYEPVHTRTVATYLNKYRPLRALKVTPFGMGTDQEYNDPLVGVPTHWQYVGTPDDLWHHSGDDLTTIDPRAYVDLVCGEGATLYSIANADDADDADFARWTAAYVKTELLNRIAGTRADRTDHTGGAADNLVQRCGMTRSALDVWQHVGVSAILSVQKLTDNTGPAEQLARQFEEFLKAEAELADCLDGHEASGTPAPSHDAVRLIPARNNAIIGTLSLDPVPVEQWKDGQVAASPRWGGARTLALWWADGKRTIAEIQQFVSAETSLDGVDLVKWFTFLSRHGYVDLHQAKA